MPEVILDGEKVSFDGPAPKTVEDVFCLLNGHLESNGLFFKEFKVNGRNVLNNFEEEVIRDGYDTVEAFSMGQGEMYEVQVRNLIKRYEALAEEGEVLAGVILRESWANTAGVVQEWMKQVVPMTKELEALGEYARGEGLEWSREIAVLLVEHEACFTAWVSAMEVGDIAVLSDSLVDTLLPMVDEIKRVLTGRVLEHFKHFEGNHEVIGSK